MSGHKMMVAAMAGMMLLVSSVPAGAQRGVNVAPPQGTPQPKESKPRLELRDTIVQSFIAALQAWIDVFIKSIFAGGFFADLFGGLVGNVDAGTNGDAGTGSGDAGIGSGDVDTNADGDNDPATAREFGPDPYRDLCDSPFDFAGLGEVFFLEDFEDGDLNTLGVSADGGETRTNGGVVEIVDLEAGTFLDEPTTGNAFRVAGGPDGITFTFSEDERGLLPTRVGIVWTEGSGTITFEAFDAGDVSLAMIEGDHADEGVDDDPAANDRFYGVIYQDGISKIKISNTLGDIQVDHLQYGQQSEALVDCDQNNRYDICDIVECEDDPACADCDENDVPDGCDIEDDPTNDLDEDGVLDICQEP